MKVYISQTCPNAGTILRIQFSRAPCLRIYDSLYLAALGTQKLRAFWTKLSSQRSSQFRAKKMGVYCLIHDIARERSDWDHCVLPRIIQFGRRKGYRVTCYMTHLKLKAFMVLRLSSTPNSTFKRGHLGQYIRGVAGYWAVESLISPGTMSLFGLENPDSFCSSLHYTTQRPSPQLLQVLSSCLRQGQSDPFF